jgi:DNA-binding beta-propeller fold protein YncE
VRNPAKAVAARSSLPLGRLGGVAMLVALVAALLAAPAPAAITHGYVGQLGGSGSAPGNFAGNRGIAVDSSNGDLFVADQFNVRIQELTSSGDPVAEWIGLSGPYGVAVDPANDRTYVTELWTNVVQVFETSTGSSLGYLDPGSGWIVVSSVAVDASSGVVYVTDRGANLVHVFDPAGNHLGEFGTAGSGAGEFSGPTGVAVDPISHDVYVVDSGNNRVERFSAEGASFLEALGGVDGPAAVTVDPANGDVYVGETSPTTRVSRYDSAGTRLYAFGSGRIGEISGLATSPAGHRVYVSDSSEESFSVKIFAPITVPTVTTGGTSEVTATKVTFHGTVNPEGSMVYAEYFQYGLDTNYGGAEFGQQFGLTGTSDIPIEVPLSPDAPLQPNRTYHYRLVAYTPAGELVGGDQTFTTNPAPPSLGELSVVTGSESATLHAEINPNNNAATFRFEYGTTSSYGSTTADGSVASAYGNTDAASEVSGLAAGTVYHFRVVAENGVDGAVMSSDRTFRTPSLSSPAADDLTGTSATLSASSEVQGAAKYRFEYGTDTSYGDTTSEIGFAGSGNDVHSEAVKGLEPGTTYHFRLVTVSGATTTLGSDGSFTTLPAPDVATSEVTDVGSGGATLHGTIDTHGHPGSYRFLVTGVGNAVSRSTVRQTISSDGPTSVTATIDDLPDASDYRVVLVGEVGGVESRGSEIELTTSAVAAAVRRNIVADADPYHGIASKAPPRTFDIVGAQVRGKAVVLTVEVPIPGRLRAVGRYLRPVGTKVTPGQVSLRLPLRRSGMRVLERSARGRLRTRVTVDFTTGDGRTSRRSRTVTFISGGSR